MTLLDDDLWAPISHAILLLCVYTKERPEKERLEKEQEPRLVYGVLVGVRRREGLPPIAAAFDYLPLKSRRSLSAKKTVVITKSVLDVSQARRFLANSTSLLDPHPRAPQVALPFSHHQTVNRVFGAGESSKGAARLPYMSSSHYWEERVATDAAWLGDVPEVDLAKIESILADFTDLRVSQGDFGSMNIVLPVTDIDLYTHTSRERPTPQIGVTLRANSNPAQENYIVTVQGYNSGNDEIWHRQYRLPLGSHCLPYMTAAMHHQVSVHDLTGDLVARETDADWQRLHSEVNFMESRTTQFSPPNAAPFEVTSATYSRRLPPSKPLTGKSWRRMQHARSKEQQASNRAILYQGTPQDRDRAVKKLREIFGETSAYCWVWDPYLEHADVAKFIMCVPNRTTDIRVLTGLRSPPRRKPAHRCAGLLDRVVAAIKRCSDGQSDLSTPRDLAMQNLQSIARTLRLDGGYENVEIRVYGGDRSHDRFIIKEGVCWQLGSSFNSIGQVVSTLIRLPIHSGIVRVFEEFWGEATRLPNE